MSISTEIARIQTDRNTIRTKLKSIGLAKDTDNLDALATAIEDMTVHSGSSATVLQEETYQIPKGYHDGTTTVSALNDPEADKKNYPLQAKTVTPTKKSQAVAPDTGKYGLSSVTVNPIPDAYQDVTGVTATAANVLAGKVFVTSTGAVTDGTMVNNGAVSKTLDTTTTSYTVPVGYHSGSGKVSISLEEKSATPTKSAQSVTPTSGKVLSKVTVGAIPNQYADTTDATATAANILAGNSAYGYETTSGGVKVAKKINGTMLNFGAVSATATPAIPNPAPIGGAGYVSSLAIIAPSESKSVTLSRSAQVIYGGTQVTGQKYGDKFLTYVEVPAIDSKLQDVSGVTATASDVLAGKKFVNSAGTVVTGSMAKIEKIDVALSPINDEYDVQTGYYYNGGVGKNGCITVASTAITVTPTDTAQTLTDDNNFYRSVTVNAIPAKYADTSTATATSSDILFGKIAFGKDSTGKAITITGSMANLGSISGSIDGINTTFKTIGAGYTTGGTISFDDSEIVAQLSAI